MFFGSLASDVELTVAEKAGAKDDTDDHADNPAS